MARISNGNYNALAWVQDELQQSIEQALASLNQYCQDSSNKAVLDSCISQLYQSSATLEMLSLEGAFLLSTEMIASAKALHSCPPQHKKLIQHSLLSSLALSSNYLKQLSTLLDDHPLRIISSINDLRSSRGDVIIEEHTLLPTIASIPLPEAVAPQPNKAKAQISIENSKLSHVFQASLLAWFKKNERHDLQQIADIVHFLQLTSTHERSVTLWWAASAVIEAILDNGLLINQHCKLTIGQLIQPIELFTRHGEQQLHAVFPSLLLQKLLLLAAHSSSSGKQVYALKQHFDLDFFDICQHQQIYNIDNKALDELYHQLLDDLTAIQDDIELLEHQSQFSSTSFESLPEQLLSIAKTLLLFIDNRHCLALLQQRADLFSTLNVQQKIPKQAQILQLSQDLLQIETLLHNIHRYKNKSVETVQLHHTVLSECIIELDFVKVAFSRIAQHIGEFSQQLPLVTDKLALVSSSLSLLEHSSAATLLNTTIGQLNTLGSSQQTISTSQLSCLAEIIARCDLFINGLIQSGIAQTQLISDGQESLNHFDWQAGTQHSPITKTLSEDTTVSQYINKMATKEKQGDTLSGVQRYINALTTDPAETETQIIKPTIASAETGVAAYLRLQLLLPKTKLNDNSLPQLEKKPTTYSDKISVFIKNNNNELDQLQLLIPQCQHYCDDSEYKQNIHQCLAKLIKNCRHEKLSILAELYQLLDQLILSANNNHGHILSLIKQGYQQLDDLLQRKVIRGIAHYKQLVEQELNFPTSELVSLNWSMPLVEKDSNFEPDVLPLANSQISVIKPSSADSDLFYIPNDDRVLVTAFSNELAELLENSDATIKIWHNNYLNNEAKNKLLGILHTIKGGARLTELSPISQLSHQAESLVLSMASHSQYADERSFIILQACQDKLAEMQHQLTTFSPLDFAHNLLADITAIIDQHSTSALTNNEQLQSKTHNLPATSSPPPTIAAASEQIRIRADFIDSLSHFSGELNLANAAISQHNSTISQQLKKRDSSFRHLQQQSHNLAAETEALLAIDTQKDDNSSGHNHLSLDRVAKLHQLSHSLNESISNIDDLDHAIHNEIANSNALLVQQSRLSADLDHQLIRSRLLPFSYIVPRFERLTRQISSELNKATCLTVIGAEQLLDRTIIDRIVTPIEHLIRNAIVHGIETSQQRRQLEKDEIGQLCLSISREGPELVLLLSDDGQGIDIDKIRQKALALKLVQIDAMPSDKELIQLIRNPGFSTEQTMTAIAGRGIGLDVVESEIKALKGQLSITSEAGKGAVFTLRLPISMSIMQAVMISCAGQAYAIPLNAITAASRAKTSDVISLLAQGDNALYHFDNESYHFVSLAQLLGKPHSFTDSQKNHLPILLFKSADKNTAIVVDVINNNQQIVVKPLGEQLNHIKTLHGATLTADGQVVFIINIPALVAANIGIVD